MLPASACHKSRFLTWITTTIASPVPFPHKPSPRPSPDCHLASFWACIACANTGSWWRHKPGQKRAVRRSHLLLFTRTHVAPLDLFVLHKRHVGVLVLQNGNVLLCQVTLKPTKVGETLKNFDEHSLCEGMFGMFFSFVVYARVT